ncbi:MAG: hypothetical protein ABSB76_18825 [Streptosporangiaceae bacterium]
MARDEPSAEDEHRNDAMVWSEQGSPDRLRLLDPGTRELTAIGGLGDRHVVEVVQRPDGGPLAVISWDRPEDEPGSFTARLHVVDPETGHVRDLGPLELALFADGLDTALHQLDTGTQRFRRVVGWAGLVDMLTASSPGDVIAARVSTAYQPAEIQAGPVGGPLTRLSDIHPELRGISWGTQKRLSYQAGDGSGSTGC